jgi:hypothetical protein
MLVLAFAAIVTHCGAVGCHTYTTLWFALFLTEISHDSGWRCVCGQKVDKKRT